MSVFRIQRKKTDTDSRQKVHSQESKSYSKNSKNLTQLLTRAQQGSKQQSPIKRRIFTLQQKQGDTSRTNIKRISEAYSISLGKKQNLKGSKVSKNSFTGSKAFQVFLSGKDSSPQVKGLIRSSPKLQGKLCAHIKANEKFNLNYKTNQLTDKNKKQYMSLNSSFVSKNSSKRLNSNRVMGKERKQQAEQLFKEALEAYKSKNSKRAEKLFKECLKIQPQKNDCLYYLGSCYLNLKQHEESIKYLESLKEVNPSYSKNVYLYWAINLKMLKKDEQAIKILENGIKIFPRFQQGYFYLGRFIAKKGKLYLKLKRYPSAVLSFEKCFSLNSKNLLSRIFLGDALISSHNEEKAIPIYQKTLQEDKGLKVLDHQTKEMTHIKLIKFYIEQEDYHNFQLVQSLSELSKINPKNSEYNYYSSVVKYEVQTDFMNSETISQIKINLYNVLSDSSVYSINLQCLKLLLRIHIDSKDFYGAQELLKRNKQEQLKKQHLIEWTLFIQGGNDVIKRKIQDGKEKLQKCLSSLNDMLKNGSIPKHLNVKQLLFLKFHVLQFLAYVSYSQQKLEQTLKIYDQIFNIQRWSQPLVKSQRKTKRSWNLSIEKFKRGYAKKFDEVELNHLVISSLVQHKINEDFEKSRYYLRSALQKRQTPQTIFMWVINELAIVKRGGNQQIESSLNQYLGCVQPDQHSKWQQLLKMCEKAYEISPNYSLMYFFQSLIYLYLDAPSEALKTVQNAIQKVEDPVSEYYFIEALCFYVISQQFNDYEASYKGLQSIDRAIQIDNGIPQFYKERSKHYFCLGKFGQAIKDCIKCMQGGDDEEAKLLCMFYYYSADDYDQSEVLLKELVKNKEASLQNSSILSNKRSQTSQNNQFCQFGQLQEMYLSESDHKYKQFQQALMFRLKKYEQAGVLSKLLLAITAHQQTLVPLDSRYIHFLSSIIQNRRTYSQFTVYFICLLMSVYSIQNHDYTTSLNYLFSCLQQIQSIIDERDRREEINRSSAQRQERQENETQKSCLKQTNFRHQMPSIDTDSMLNEVKYNIIVATLFKNQSQRRANFIDQKSSQRYQKRIEAQQVYSQTLNFINTFLRESDSEQLVENISIIKRLILTSQSKVNGQQKQQDEVQKKVLSSIYLKPYVNTPKFSDEFPQVRIQIGNTYNLITRFVVFFPLKLKFNIKPQFDPSFLFNFDIDKVQNKITPPWFKFSSNQLKSKYQNRIIFTDQLRNESITISQTERQPSILQNHLKHSKHRYQNRYVNESQRKIMMKSMNEPKNDHEDFRKMVKLDSNIQKKLNKLFHKE